MMATWQHVITHLKIFIKQGIYVTLDNFYLIVVVSYYRFIPKLSSSFFPFSTNRAINGQALVGNIGGYLGLFLGYSILQLPGMIEIVAKKIRNWHLWMMISRDNAVKEVLYPVMIGEDAFGDPSDV